MASAEREPIKGVWGQSPQWGPGAEPLVGARGKAALKLKAFQTLDVEKRHQIILTISLVSHKLIPRISITNYMCPAHGSIRRDFCIVYLIFLTELLGPTPTPLRRPMHLQQVTTALIIITSHYDFR